METTQITIDPGNQSSSTLVALFKDGVPDRVSEVNKIPTEIAYDGRTDRFYEAPTTGYKLADG